MILNFPYFYKYNSLKAVMLSNVSLAIMEHPCVVFWRSELVTDIVTLFCYILGA